MYNSNVNVTNTWTTIIGPISGAYSLSVQEQAGNYYQGDVNIHEHGSTGGIQIEAVDLRGFLTFDRFFPTNFKFELSRVYQFQKVGTDIQVRLISGVSINVTFIAYYTFAGPTGATGLQGQSGETGETGPTGEAGAQGATGLQGSEGATGPTGEAGAQGATGIQGSEGATGPTGDAGAQGATGIQGSEGVTGPTGEAGAQGATGIQGSEGVTGPTGANGLNGTTGATGADGTNGTNGTNGSNATVTVGYGSMGVAGAFASVTAAQTKKFSNFTTTGYSMLNFTRPADNQLTYTGTPTINVLAIASLSVSSSAAGTVSISIGRTTSQPASPFAMLTCLHAAGQTINYTVSGLFTLATNQYLSVWGYCGVASTLSIQTGALNAFAVV